MKKVLFPLLLATILSGCSNEKRREGSLLVITGTDGSEVYIESGELWSVGLQGFGREPMPPARQDAEGHVWVDLGLPSGTLWATCNIGANEAEESGGNYFAWGETDSKRSFRPDNYCFETVPGHAVPIRYGKGWQMPSVDQFAELFDAQHTLALWTMRGGVPGRLVVSRKYGNSIFLPAAGFYDETSIRRAGYCGYYWTCSSDTTQDASDTAFILFFDSNTARTEAFVRHTGLCVRPVRKE